MSYAKCLPLLCIIVIGCGDDSAADAAVDPDASMDGATDTGAADARDDAAANDSGVDAAADTSTDASGIDATRTDAGPLPPSVLFFDDFNSYSAMDIDGRCVSPTDDGCASAVFPWEGSGAEPGWTFLWTGGGESGSYPHVARITETGARSGMNVQMWDENQHELGGGQWGHDFQFAKYWPEEQFDEIWLEMWVYWSSPEIRTTNQKMTHIFHYDAEWLADGRGFFNTSESTDGGVICNWRQEAGNMEFRCSVRCSTPPDYQCSVSRSGTSFVSPDGSTWNGRSSRFAMLVGETCTPPTDGSYESVFADGRWHKFEVGLRMNSSPGRSDGQLELWFDECRLGLLSGIPFREDGADAAVAGFNGVTFGGNAQPNDWGPDGTDGETWQVDDLRICSERCPD